MNFLIHRGIAVNLEEFFSTNRRVAAVLIKLNKRYRLKIVQAYAPTTSCDDEAVDIFCKNMESAMKNGSTEFTIVIGYFNAKVDQKQIRERLEGNFEIDNGNNGGDTLV